MKRRQSGFTLIELLVVIGILAVLMAIVLVAINPARQFRQSNRTRRTADINAILNALTQYGADNRGNYANIGAIPLDGTQISLASGDPNGVLICNAIIPTYIASLPADPDPARGTGVMPTVSPCAGAWNTGYVVSIATTGRVTVSSLASPTVADAAVTEDLTVTR